MLLGWHAFGRQPISMLVPAMMPTPRRAKACHPASSSRRMDYFEFQLRIPKHPWKWIRFRITTILLLIAIVAMALAWKRDHEQLTQEMHRLRHPGPYYQAEQATGPPNTGAGDGVTSWCHLTSDDQQEWLVLEYDTVVVPKAIVVHENLSPGGLRRVSSFPKIGIERTLWEGTDPTPITATSGVSRLPITAGIKTNRIKLYIDSPAVPGWQEIDAVGLIYGEDNKVIWAKRASASSTYGDMGGPNWETTGVTLMR